jgi:hypothetical protein
MFKSPIVIGPDYAGSDSVGPDCAGPDCTCTLDGQLGKPGWSNPNHWKTWPDRTKMHSR